MRLPIGSAVRSWLACPLLGRVEVVRFGPSSADNVRISSTSRDLIEVPLPPGGSRATAIGMDTHVPQNGEATGRRRVLETIVEWARELLDSEASRSHHKHARAAVLRAARQQQWRGFGEITPASIRRHMAFLKRRKIAGPKTRNTIRAYLSKWCDFLVGEKLLPSNPVRATRRARVIRRKARVVPTEDQFRRLIAAARAEPRTKDRWLVYLTAATTGLRFGTLKVLEWVWVHETAALPYFELPGQAVKPKEPKVIWMTAELARELAAHRRRAGGRVRVFESVPKWEGFCRDVDRAGLDRGRVGQGPTLSFHSLKHFASNRAMWLGLSDEQRAALMGNSSVEIIRDVYTDPEAVELGRKTLKLPGLLGGPDSWGRRPPGGEPAPAGRLAARLSTMADENLTTRPPPADSGPRLGDPRPIQGTRGAGNRVRGSNPPTPIPGTSTPAQRKRARIHSGPSWIHVVRLLTGSPPRTPPGST